eukprot:CAMPEP_0204609654 /NCGR_PEP_ID=MMETSP0661-20131031/61043_1 /ASSEMBLY_ACC=CAM_ASM_000606 /TAXON_ID=109239 /ORGANISM="Alexandrium margalefi, Strain AMGDE01CS-322" /LENGTH=136 /DNA_ID=CAMNT_0051621351 /DNA_START=576 /DNA_END=982 /DNA_ORIENTATION=+
MLSVSILQAENGAGRCAGAPGARDVGPGPVRSDRTWLQPSPRGGSTWTPLPVLDCGTSVPRNAPHNSGLMMHHKNTAPEIRSIKFQVNGQDVDNGTSRALCAQYCSHPLKAVMQGIGRDLTDNSSVSGHAAVREWN